MKKLFAVPAAALAILSAPVAITATRVTATAVPVAVATTLAVAPTKADAAVLVPAYAVNTWARFRSWVEGLILSE